MTKYDRGWLKQQTYISHSFGGWHVQNQGAGLFGSWLGLSSRLVDGYLLIVLSCGKRALVSPFSYKDTNPIMGAHLHDLI